MKKAIFGSLVIMSLLSMSYTFSYWQWNVLGSSVTTSNQITIGEWDDKKTKIRVHRNLSDDFADFDIDITPNTSLGTQYATYFNFIPKPKTHSGVDQSIYTFDNWYLTDGTIFTSSTVVNTSIDVYPSWNSFKFNYTLDSGKYNLMYDTINNTLFDLTGDFYAPGWRYQGRVINMICSYFFKFTNYDFNGVLTIGSGIKIIYRTAFMSAKVRIRSHWDEWF